MRQFIALGAVKERKDNYVNQLRQSKEANKERNSLVASCGKESCTCCERLLLKFRAGMLQRNMHLEV